VYEEHHVKSIYLQAFGDALTFASEGLKAATGLVAFSGNGRLLNLNADSLWTTEPISLTLLRTLVEDPKPSLLLDSRDPGFNVTSVTLASIHSVLFMPIRARTQEVCGCLYLDNRLRHGAFREEDLKQLEVVVEGRLEPLLAQTGACRPLTWELLQNTCWLTP